MRPWNPAFQEVWDKMSERERRVSARFDIAVLVAVLGMMWLFG